MTVHVVRGDAGDVPRFRPPFAFFFEQHIVPGFGLARDLEGNCSVRCVLEGEPERGIPTTSARVILAKLVQRHFDVKGEEDACYFALALDPVACGLVQPYIAVFVGSATAFDSELSFGCVLNRGQGVLKQGRGAKKGEHHFRECLLLRELFVIVGGRE